MSSDMAAGPSVNIENLIGPLTEALAPQLKSLLESQFSQERFPLDASSSSNSNGKKSAQENENVINENNNSGDHGAPIVSGHGTRIVGGRGTPIVGGHGTPIVADHRTAKNSCGSKRGHSKDNEYDYYYTDDYYDEKVNSDGEENPPSIPKKVQVLDPLSTYLVDDGAWVPPPQTLEYLLTYMRKNLSDRERSAILENFPLPDSEMIKMPKIDTPVLKLLKRREISIRYSGIKRFGKYSKRLLESLGPLTVLHGACYDALAEGYDLNPDRVLEAVSNAISLVGNANSKACNERRRVILWTLEPELASLATGVDLTTTDNLFGPNIWEGMKSCVDLESNIETIVKKSKPFDDCRRGGRNSGNSYRGRQDFRGEGYFRGNNNNNNDFHQQQQQQSPSYSQDYYRGGSRGCFQSSRGRGGGSERRFVRSRGSRGSGQ